MRSFVRYYSRTWNQGAPVKRLVLPVVACVLAASACDSRTLPTAAPEADEGSSTVPTFAKVQATEDFSHIVAFVDDFNTKLEAAGSNWRLEYPWLFRVGPGTDPFGTLRTGVRWPVMNVGYILDESDYTTDVPFAEVDVALESAYESWNDIRNSNLTAVRQPDGGGNYDVFDGTIVGGQCLTLFDLSSPNLDLAAGLILPEADIVVGGWVSADYFSQCLGDPSIIGVTWTFFDVDTNGDQYLDLLYVEQFYNPIFDWTTTDAVYLDDEAPIDIETIAVHENGHAHGLGHFGGPINRQPFRLQPNGKVFNPEAVMNPFYIGGEERTPLPTDVAGMRTMYARR